MNLLCSFGLHRWTPWKYGKVTQHNLISGMFMNSQDVDGKIRFCSRCGYRQIKIT